jgi:hypothetical protein
MSKKPPMPPVGIYGPNRDGLLDPDRASLADRQHKSVARLSEELYESRLLSPFIRTLRSAASRALKGR